MATHKNQQMEPPTFPSPLPSQSPFILPVTTDEDTAMSRRSSAQYLRRRRRCFFFCCGCCGATFVVLGLAALILSSTLFNVTDPTVTFISLYLDDPVSVNATALTADISIKNPNVASLKYGRSTTEFYYEGQRLGVAYAPEGVVGAHKTVTMNLTVEVLAGRVAMTNATSNAFAGSLVNVTTFTDINGVVDVWGLYKRDIDVMLNCSMSLDLSIQSQQITNKVCVANMI